MTTEDTARARDMADQYDFETLRPEEYIAKVDAQAKAAREQAARGDGSTTGFKVFGAICAAVFVAFAGGVGALVTADWPSVGIHTGIKDGLLVGLVLVGLVYGFCSLTRDHGVGKEPSHAGMYDGGDGLANRSNRYDAAKWAVARRRDAPLVVSLSTETLDELQDRLSPMGGP
jgi:hypothetical protein